LFSKIFQTPVKTSTPLKNGVFFEPVEIKREQLVDSTFPLRGYSLERTSSEVG
jgi:hypothetical protein